MARNTGHEKGIPYECFDCLPKLRHGHRVKRFLIFCLLLASGAAAVQGKSALDGSDPNATNGAVRVVVVQPDGKILIGGNFSAVLGVARNNIARLNMDSTLDTAFDPNANKAVQSIAACPLMIR